MGIQTTSQPTTVSDSTTQHLDEFCMPDHTDSSLSSGLYVFSGNTVEHSRGFHMTGPFASFLNITLKVLSKSMKAAPSGPDSSRHVNFAARIVPALIGAMFLVAGFSAHAANLTVDGAQRFQTIDGRGVKGTQISGTIEAASNATDVVGNVSAQKSAVSANATTFAFDDEFNAGALDTTQWVAMNRKGDSSNNEQQYYLPTNVALSNGLLNITSKADNSVPGYSYTSGMVQWKSFNFTYGTIEFRAKMAGGQGTWPAVWLLGYNCQASNVTSADNTGACKWPQPGSDEIDITEIKNGALTTVWQNVFSGGVANSCTPTTTDVSQNWHTYDLIWAPGSLTWQIDGTTTCHMTTGVPSTPMFLILNTAMGGAGGGAINAGTLPQTLSLDYVRVTLSDTIAPAVPTGFYLLQKYQ